MSDEPPNDGNFGDVPPNDTASAEPRAQMATLPGAASVPPAAGSVPPRGGSVRPVSVPRPVSAPAPTRDDAPTMPRVPGPPTLPLLPDFEAWATAAEAVKSPEMRAAERMRENVMTPEPPQAMTPTPEPSSSGRRRSRRMVKIPDDRVPLQTPQPASVLNRLADLNFQSSPDPDELFSQASLEDGRHPVASPPPAFPIDAETLVRKVVPSRKIDLSKTMISDPPEMDEAPPPLPAPPPPVEPVRAREESRATPVPPRPASQAPPRQSAPPAAPGPPSSPPRPPSQRPIADIESETQIRPVRIISIGSDPPRANTEPNGTLSITAGSASGPLLNEEAFARAPLGAWVDLGEVGQPPTGADVEEVESLDDEEVYSQRTHDSDPPTHRGPRDSEENLVRPPRDSEENLARVSVDSIEEIETETHVSGEVPIMVEEEEPKAAPPPPPQAKKPPPPPPKRERLGSIPEATPNTSVAAPASSPASAPMPQSVAKRQKPWWEELFGDDFLRTMERLDRKFTQRECNFIEEHLGVEPGAVILDLACGPGLHAVELASRGYSVVGYDLSLAMLARAADEAQERGQRLNFLQGDMREMAFDGTFDAIYSWNTSFGYFDDEKNYDVLRRIHKALRQGGILLLDVINHDYVVCRQPSLVWFEGEGCVCMDEMGVDSFSSRLRVKRTVMFEDGRTREVDYSIRLYALHELGKMLHEVGFKVVEVTGNLAHPGVFFGSDSPRITIVAERAEAKNRQPPPGVPGTSPTDKPE